MTTQPRSNDAGKQGDLLLWVAGGVVAAVGVAWLVIMKPWGGGSDTVAQVESPVVVAVAATPPPGSDEAAAPEGDEGTLGNPLHMAELAYQAGMLVEPEEYSAWTLYSRVAKAEPNNTAAAEGLAKVADDLVRRGETALEQGRFDDARATVERIHAVLPAHPGAKALGEKIWPATGVAMNSREADTFKPEIPVQQPLPKVAPVEVVPQPAPKPVVDPLVEAGEAFEQAMAAGRLLTPADQSAKHFVEVLVDANPSHDVTRKARERLSREFLSRATQSLEALDTEAAGIWIDEAEAMGVDLGGVRTARAELTDQQIALESAKPLPASALKIATYVAPEYPDRANERRIEGWVDVEFTILTDGTTRDVAVANASHELYFRREALAAVGQWKFEPRIFMNRPIEQRSYTRIRFVQ
jgi:TonB family protein